MTLRAPSPLLGEYCRQILHLRRCGRARLLLAKAACNSRLLAPAPRLHSPRHRNHVGKFYSRRDSAEFAGSETHEHEYASFSKLTSKVFGGRDAAPRCGRHPDSVGKFYILLWWRRRMTYYPIENPEKVERGKNLALTQEGVALVQESCNSCECVRAGRDIGETEIIQQLSFPIRLIVPAVAGASIALPMPAAHAGFSLDGGSSFAVLYEGNGGKQLQYNNSNVTGNIGIGGTGQ